MTEAAAVAPSETVLDKDVVKYIQAVEAAGAPPAWTLTPEQARAAYREARKKTSSGGPENLSVRTLAANESGNPVPVRIYRPDRIEEGFASPALVFCHGGGWLLGDLNTHDTACRILADKSGVVVIAVDYRMAPEHKFPTAVNDVYATAEWIAGPGAQPLSIDPEHLAIGGDSAGATLAIVTAISAREHAGPKFRLQLLIYPATDLRRESRSQQLFKSGYLLTESMQAWLTDHYLQDASQMTDWRASPKFAGDLSNLPPAWILTAGFDPLRDEGLSYVTSLAESGCRSHTETLPRSDSWVCHPRQCHRAGERGT